MRMVKTDFCPTKSQRVHIYISKDNQEKLNLKRELDQRREEKFSPLRARSEMRYSRLVSGSKTSRN